MSLHGENGMGNGTKYHDRAVYGDLAELLDAAYRHWDEADHLASARNREDAERNAVAEQRAARYERLKAQARRMHDERPRGLYATEAVNDWREIAVMEVG